MHISELDTPALVIDLDVMERNLERVSNYARDHKLRLRPHTKTHKIPALGRRQIELGAAGLTVAKVGEAEVMLAADPPDLLVAYPVLGGQKLARLMKIAKRTRVSVALDSLTAARQLSEAAAASGVEIGVLAEMDVGLGRVGVDPGPQLVDLSKAIEKLPNLRLAGIAFYPGHIKQMDDAGIAALEKLSRVIEETLEQLSAAGINVDIVSGGSTPALWHSHCVRGLTEIRPGTYIFNDRNTVASGACRPEDCAASIITTVVSNARPGLMMVDGGSKTFSSDRLGPTGEATFGYVLEAPGATYVRQNEEHGYIDLRHSERSFEVGERVRIIPNHICVAMNLHETVFGVRGEEVKEMWRVEGRGKLQ
jgi:D-serine deaminase-like pyridoxal phosphate-dependent protein